MREHWINPVLYVEYVDINGADKSLLEVRHRFGRHMRAFGKRSRDAFV